MQPSTSSSLLPDAVEDVPVRVDPDVEVGGEDVVESSDLLVPEESIRHPDLTGVREGEVTDPLWKGNVIEGEEREKKRFLKSEI